MYRKILEQIREESGKFPVPQKGFSFFGAAQTEVGYFLGVFEAIFGEI